MEPSQPTFQPFTKERHGNKQHEYQPEPFKHLQNKEVEPFVFDKRHVTSGNFLGEATETVYGRGASALTEIVYG